MITPFQQLCAAYLTHLRTLRQSALATDELSLRPALDSFLTQTAQQLDFSVQFVGEAKKIAAGRPDFTVAANQFPIGYIEAEAYNVNLDALSGHAKEQNERFRANLDNFLVTDHLEFRLYVGGALVDRARLAAPPESGVIRVTADEAGALETLLTRFLQGQIPAIASPKDLATHLARRTRQIYTEVLHVLRDPQQTGGDIQAQYAAFREVLLPDLNEEQFAGLYAQTITYGLFAARCMPESGARFSRQAAAALVPKTNPFLRKLFQRIAAFDLDPRLAWIADDAAQLLAKAPMAEILADFGARSGKEDPVVHFYETFLAAYDPKVREVRGVYYTPEPVVAYIVRSIDHLLKTRFNKPLGLADEHTLILDPATGTGSFLFAVVRQVHAAISQIAAGAWNDYVEQKLLPRLFGFELLIAPYAIAHLKLGLQLQELGYTFKSEQRLGIYLTNTLEEALKKTQLLFGKFVSDEANEAATIKADYPILVLLGNPPYSGHSANRSEYFEYIPPGQTYRKEGSNGEMIERTAGKQGVKVKRKTFIGRLLEDYRYVDGKALREKNPKWLQDDYVKFIRFAQWRIEQTGEGILGYITNHGYLDNPTFRGLRQSLMRTYNEIYIYNLHGNSRKKEIPPQGGYDENVFDIQQGVAILICVKEKHNPKPARVFYADLWCSRTHKYQVLSQTCLDKTEWKELEPSASFYMFVPQNNGIKTEYEQFPSTADIFMLNSVGIVTARDVLTIHWNTQELFRTITDFASLSVEHAREKYQLGQDARDWKVEFAQQDLKDSGLSQACAAPMLYRPFDLRYTYYTGNSRGFHCMPRGEIMRHLLGKENVALITTRQTRDEWAAFVTNTLCGHKTCAKYDINFLFPLYLYPDEINGQTAIDAARRPNFSPQFLKALSQTLKLPQAGQYGLPEGVTPEDIFHYAYAVFHSPAYRERYAEFLKIDFPRLPLTADLDLFRDLAALGKQLAALHLLDASAAPALTAPAHPFPRSGDNIVDKLKYDEDEQRVYINTTQYFERVPPEVWEFRVGGYQVCDKWLKDRKGRQLSFDDIQHYQRTLIALARTIALMAAIDERIPGWPLQ